MTGKTCTECKKTLDRENFYPHNGTKDKLRPKCIPCSKEEKRQYRKNNREAVRAIQKAYREKYPERIRESNRKYIEAHYEEHLARSRKYYHDHREQVQAYQTAYNKELRKNKERVRDWLIAKYEGTPCMDCGGVFAWCAMDFDHRPGTVKELKIGAVGSKKAIPKRIAQIEKEITKCDIVCSNCHRVRTQERHERISA